MPVMIKKMNSQKKILPMTELLPLLATIELEDHSAAKLRNGWQPSVEMMKEHDLPLLKAGDMVKFIQPWISSGGCGNAGSGE